MSLSEMMSGRAPHADAEREVESVMRGIAARGT
jgi:hypothetical protein